MDANLKSISNLVFIGHQSVSKFNNVTQTLITLFVPEKLDFSEDHQVFFSALKYVYIFFKNKTIQFIDLQAGNQNFTS